MNNGCKHFKFHKEKIDRVLCFSLSRFLFISLFSVGQQSVKLDNQFKVMCVALHPSNPEVFLCGGYSSSVKAWDSRICKVKLINLLTVDLPFLLTPVH